MPEPAIHPLLELLYRIKKSENDNPVVVFDLDSTLFSNAGRTLAIFSEWIGENPRYRRLIYQLFPRTMLWSIDADFRNRGVPQEILEGFRDFWWERFFCNSIIRYDRPMPGAAAYVHRVLDAGAKVLYASGRDEPRMGEGTRSSLERFGFPMNRSGVSLILKEGPEVKDADFKKGVVKQIRAAGTAVGFFEDQPAFAINFQKGFPEALVVLMDVPHPADSPAPPRGMPRITDFLLPEQNDRTYLIVMSGLPGTGKSTVAINLAQSVEGDHLSTDEIRENLFSSTSPTRQEKYSDQAKKRVYSILYENAEQALSEKRSVVLDGTFLRNSRVGLQQIATNHGAHLVFAKTTCSEQDVAKRMEQRKLRRDFFSEAHTEIYTKMKRRLESSDGRYLDVGDDPLVTRDQTPLIVFDTGQKQIHLTHSDPKSPLIQRLVVDFPLYQLFPEPPHPNAKNRP